MGNIRQINGIPVAVEAGKIRCNQILIILKTLNPYLILLPNFKQVVAAYYLLTSLSITKRTMLSMATVAISCERKF